MFERKVNILSKEMQINTTWRFQLRAMTGLLGKKSNAVKEVRTQGPVSTATRKVEE